MECEMRRFWLLATAGFLAPMGCSSTPGPEEDQVELPPTAVSQIEELLAEKAARTSAQRKIASQLLYERSGRFASAVQETKDPKNRITSLAQADAKGRVLVDI